MHRREDDMKGVRADMGSVTEDGMRDQGDSGNSPRVYLVEDDADLRSEMVGSLERLGFDVTGLPGVTEFHRAHAYTRGDIAVLCNGLEAEDVLSITSRLRASDFVGVIVAWLTRPDEWHLTEGGWVLCAPNGKRLRLSTVERSLVSCLFELRGKVVSRERLFTAISGNAQDFVDSRRIDILVYRIRRKAARAGMKLPLHSVRGAGYMLAI
jgi:two-component system response regulator PhoP